MGAGEAGRAGALVGRVGMRSDGDVRSTRRCAWKSLNSEAIVI